MSDILKSLLQAYRTDLDTVTATGGAMAYIAYHELIQSPLILPPDWSAPLPFILIYPQPITLTPDVMGIKSNDKLYHIVFSVFQEYPDVMLGLLGDAYIKGVIDIADDLQDRYDRNTLNVSNFCRLTQISYDVFTVPPFDGTHQVHVTFQHQWKDRRSS